MSDLTTGIHIVADAGGAEHVCRCAVHAEVAELRKDKARLDWLLQSHFNYEKFWREWDGQDSNSVKRSAIDAAMESSHA